MERFVCIHGHFYQPPRENPWLEAIELQDSAYPYHDWNERITAECYAPERDGADPRRREPHRRDRQQLRLDELQLRPDAAVVARGGAPDVYAAILEADRRSAERFSGHGSALAQAYNHMILPLANAPRQGDAGGLGHPRLRAPLRPAAGGDVAAGDGGRPRDARGARRAGHPLHDPRAPPGERRARARRRRRGRTLGGKEIDPTRPYRVPLPVGRVDRGLLLRRPDLARGRVRAAAALEGRGLRRAARWARSPPRRGRAELVHIATDGETYGHHHRHGDMALAYALHTIETGTLARLTNYGEFLERFPPTHEVAIVETTSWSCAHGVERWRSDCGCQTGAHAGWNQAWRAPLRDALDWLRDGLAPLFETGAAGLLSRPVGGARRLHRRDPRPDRPRASRRFLARHAAPGALARRAHAGPEAPRDAAPRAAHVHELRLVLRRPLRDRDAADPPVRRPRAPARPGASFPARTSRPGSSTLSDRRRATSPRRATAGASTRRPSAPRWSRSSGSERTTRSIRSSATTGRTRTSTPTGSSARTTGWPPADGPGSRSGGPA